MNFANQTFCLLGTHYKAAVLNKQIVLIKAAKVSPGQLSLWEESSHPRDNRGRFRHAKSIEDVDPSHREQFGAKVQSIKSDLKSDTTWRKYGLLAGRSYQRILDEEGAEIAEEALDRFAHRQATYDLVEKHNRALRDEERAAISSGDDPELQEDLRMMEAIAPTYLGTLEEFKATQDLTRFNRLRGAMPVDFTENSQSPFKAGDRLTLWDGDEAKDLAFDHAEPVIIVRGGRLVRASSKLFDRTEGYETNAFVFKDSKKRQTLITAVELERNGLYKLPNNQFVHEYEPFVNEEVADE